MGSATPIRVGSSESRRDSSGKLEAPDAGEYTGVPPRKSLAVVSVDGMDTSLQSLADINASMIWMGNAIIAIKDMLASAIIKQDITGLGAFRTRLCATENIPLEFEAALPVALVGGAVMSTITNTPLAVTFDASAPLNVKVLNRLEEPVPSLLVNDAIRTSVENSPLVHVANDSTNPLYTSNVGSKDVHLYVKDCKTSQHGNETWKPALGWGFDWQAAWYDKSGLYNTNASGAVLMSQPSLVDPAAGTTDQSMLATANKMTNTADNKRFGVYSGGYS